MNPEGKLSALIQALRSFDRFVSKVAIERVAFDCVSQEKVAHGHVAYVCKEGSKTASKGAQNGSHL